jgi:hypothetical protein
MEVANMDMARPAAAMTEPTMVTARQPYLLTNVLAIGPGPEVSQALFFPVLKCFRQVSTILFTCKKENSFYFTIDRMDTCSEGDPDKDGWDEGDGAPVGVELVYQGHEEDAEGVGDSVS